MATDQEKSLRESISALRKQLDESSHVLSVDLSPTEWFALKAKAREASKRFLSDLEALMIERHPDAVDKQKFIK